MQLLLTKVTNQRNRQQQHQVSSATADLVNVSLSYENSTQLGSFVRIGQKVKKRSFNFLSAFHEYSDFQ